MPKIAEMDDSQLPRERMEQSGPGALSDAELLAVLLRTGSTGENVLQLAARLLREAQGLHGLSRMDLGELSGFRGIKSQKATTLAAVFELARRLTREQARQGRMDTPEAIYRLMAPELQPLRQESLRVVLLDTRLRLMRTQAVSLGSLNEAIADPREILRPAVVHNAYGLVLVHNHPSGDPTPSQNDRTMTRGTADACALLRVKLVDHIIVGVPGPGNPGYFSFREAGLL